MTRSTQI